MAGTITLDDEMRRAGDGTWDELIGQQVGSYRLVQLLGKGGMGAVYLAKQPAIGSRVAIKLLHPRFSGDRAVVERFFNEARAVNLIGHENILKIIDLNVTPENRYYCVMEFLSGRPLQALLKEGKPVPLPVAGPILLQCCRALQAAHERQIVHRDLKPDNIFLIAQMGRKNFVKIVDFGIAKLVPLVEGEKGLTEAGSVLGTPEYMSPEQASGRADVGRRSDVYSLGVVMYQLATGRVPFSGPSTVETLIAHLQQAPPPPRSLEPSVPEAYEAIILRALAKKKEDRFPSMAELGAAISACMASLGISAELPLADEIAPAQLDEAGEGRVAEEAQGAAPPLTQTFAGESAAAPPLARLGDRVRLAARRRPALLLAGAAGVVIVVALALRGPAARQAPARPASSTAETQQVAPASTHAAAPPQHPGSPVPGAPAKIAPAPAPAVQPTAPATARPEPPPRRPTGTRSKPAAPAVSKPTAPAVSKPGPTAVGKPAAAVPAKLAPVASEPAGPGAMTASAAAAAAAAEASGEREHAKVLRAIAEMQQAATDAAAAESKEPKLPGAARLFIASDPPGAAVTVAWSGKSATGRTPIVFKVRRGAAVSVAVSLPGRASELRELAAAATQAVVVELKKER